MTPVPGALFFPRAPPPVVPHPPTPWQHPPPPTRPPPPPPPLSPSPGSVAAPPTAINVAALRACLYPVVFVVADQDEVVGPQQGRKLHSSFSASKLLIELPGCSHNGFELGPEVDWVRAVDAFLRGRPAT